MRKADLMADMRAVRGAGAVMVAEYGVFTAGLSWHGNIDRACMAWQYRGSLQVRDRDVTDARSLIPERHSPKIISSLTLCLYKIKRL